MARRARREKDEAMFRDMPTTSLKVEVSSDFKCDVCGTPSGTLYLHQGLKDGELVEQLVCLDDMPFSYRHGNLHTRLLSLAVSGKKAIESKRAKMRR
jgi:hypothetical protein